MRRRRNPMTKFTLAGLILALMLLSVSVFAEDVTGVAYEEPGWFKIPGTDTKLKFDCLVELDTHCELSGGFEGRMREYGYGASAQSIAFHDEKVCTPQIAMTASNSLFSFGTITPSSIGNIGTFFKVDACQDMAITQQSTIRRTPPMVGLGNGFSWALISHYFTPTPNHR